MKCPIVREPSRLHDLDLTDCSGNLTEPESAAGRLHFDIQVRMSTAGPRLPTQSIRTRADNSTRPTHLSQIGRSWTAPQIGCVPTNKRNEGETHYRMSRRLRQPARPATSQ